MRLALSGTAFISGAAQDKVGTPALGVHPAYWPGKVLVCKQLLHLPRMVLSA